MALRLPNATRSAMVTALVARFDNGTGPGTLQIRTGSQPTTANDTATGTLLATVTLADPAFGSPTNGVATLTDPAAVTAVATGTAGWFRGLDSTGATVVDGSVTATVGGGDIELATVSITSGLSVDITGGTITMPGS